MDNIKYNLKKERFTIMNVDEVSTADALAFIKKMMDRYPDYPVFSRTVQSLYDEFCVHKLCYKWHIFRKRTKDAGMQYPLSKTVEFLYKVFGKFSRHFI